MMLLGLLISAVLAQAPTPAPRNPSSPLYGLTTQTYNGSMVQTFYDKNGYDDAMMACQADYGNKAHVCTAAEVGLIAQFDSLYHGNYRYIDMSFQRDFTKTPPLLVTDCKGFTTDSLNESSHCIKMNIGGAVLPSFCDCARPLALLCCRDLTYK